jgi:hypothetical protein
MRILHLACTVLFAVCAAARPAVSQTGPDSLLQAHHDAYNRKDLVGLLAAYAPDAVQAHPGDTVFHGVEQIASFYKEHFMLMQGVRVEVRNRTTSGNTVVEELFYRGFPCGGTHLERVTYEVEDRRIRNVTREPLSSDVVAMIVGGTETICFPESEGGRSRKGKP